MSLTDRFLRYVGVDTQSDHTSDTVPSTPGQCELAQILKQELGPAGGSLWGFWHIWILPRS